MIGKKARFETKFAKDEKYNGKICKIIDIVSYRDEVMYIIEFKDKKRLKVYDTELIIL
jgi:hypothetical protein